jgi:hypothetical protein
MTTLTRWTAAAFRWFEQIDRWIEEITRFHKARYSAPYRWCDVENRGIWYGSPFYAQLKSDMAFATVLLAAM